MSTPLNSLSEVQKWLSAQTPGSSLTVNKSEFTSSLILKFFELVEIDKIALSDIKIPSADKDKAILKGSATFLSYDNVELTLAFTEPESALILECDFNLGSAQWGLVEKLDLGLKGILGSIYANVKLEMLFLEFEATLEVSDKDYPLPIKIGIPSTGGEWQLSGSFEDAGKLSADIISTLTGIDDITSMMPSDLIDPNNIKLTSFKTSYDPFNNTCSYLKVGIDYTKEGGWPIFSDKFIFDGIVIEFEVFHLIGSTVDMSYQAMLAGNFDISGIKLQMGGTFPTKAVFAKLVPGEKLYITKVFEKMDVTLPSGFPDIIVSKLGFTAFLESPRSYEFEIEITDAFTIVDKVQLQSFQFSIQAKENSTTKKYDVNGILGGQFKIGETIIGLRGNYSSTGPSTVYGFAKNIPVGSLIEELSHKFEIDDLPGFLSKLVIDELTVTYSTDKKFDFHLRATTEITDNDEVGVVLSIKTSYDETKKKYTGTYTGTISIASRDFTLEFDNTDESILSASLDAQSNPLELEDLARFFNNPSLTEQLSEIPESMKLSLTHAGIAYNFTSGLLVITAVSENYGSVYFVADKVEKEGKKNWVFALGVALKRIDIADMPLIGEDLAKLGEIGIDDLSLIILSNDLDKAQVESINKTLDKQSGTYPRIPNEDVKAGVAFSLEFDFLGNRFPFNVGTSQDEKPPQHIRDIPSTAVWLSEGSSKSKNGFWITLDKGLGPIYFNRIGANYVDGSLYLLFDVAMIITVLRIDLMGLSVGSPLSEFDPEFGLDGLNIAYSSGPIMISGGFLAVERDGFTEYIGQAMIKTPMLALSALGAYAKVNGDISLFIFALINKPPIGGYPYLYVTGLAGGFGYNRSLVLPAIEELVDFPLVSGFVPGQTSPFSGGDPTKALRMLSEKNVIPVDIGQYWLAAGIQFTSFQLLQSFALLAVQFGNKLEVAVLGISSAAVPTGAPRPLMQAQLALSARIIPDDGILTVEAQLTKNSFILDTNCHLIGGFAFYLWFGDNPNSGNFVVTLGGYNPRFDAPDYYPDVPRLGFNWVVTSNLNIKGGMYFALTPSCLMAGGSMEAVWKSGNLKAWFNMGAHFLVAWKPFHYEAQLYISFGVSYTFNINLLFTTVRKTISVSLGAGLEIWGPDFSGTAYIHLWIVSFSIDFGASASKKPAPIGWEDFKKSFLPDLDSSNGIQGFPSHALQLMEGDVVTDSYCAPKVISGLVKDVTDAEDNPQDINYIVRRHGARFVTNTVLPSKSGKVVVDGKEITSFVNQSEYDSRNQKFGIGPMGIANEHLSSVHEVQIKRELGPLSSEVEIFVRAIIEDVPKSLWQDTAAGLENDMLISKVLVGFEIWTNALEPEVTPWVNTEILINNKGYDEKLEFLNPAFEIGPDQPTDPIKELESTIAATPGRTDILDVLAAQHFNTDETVDVSHLSKQAGDYLLAPPVFAYEYLKSA